ncbi:response regulator [Paratractidigestivibacter sp.]|uniref:response regulator n=1 Tax=Paratractidigestivibacter sp. TaxID=2847316 RepID=UPI002ABD6C62|nr:response regulator [Paratractidigestivibacter sp.]
MNILVVDDKRLAVNALIRILGEIDPSWPVEGVTSGEEALVIAKGNRPDVVFLDIEMPGISGLELARRLREMSQDINIVFVTAHSEYALEAHGLYPSGYLLKPATEDDVRRALENLRHPVASGTSARLQAHCFGTFDIMVDGKPVPFKRSKTKELVAFLIDRQGARVNSDELVNALWEDGVSSVSRRAQVRNLISDMRSTFDALGVGDVIVRGRDALAILPDAVDCDYYRFLKGDLEAVNNYNGEYMNQYWWSEMTLANLNGGW